jgi:hypothetical protein
VQGRHTRDFSKISANKINNLRKSDSPKIFRREKIFFEKNRALPCSRYQKISATAFWRIRPKLTFQKISEDANKKKVIGAFSRNCLRMQKAPIKFVKLGRWDMALVCVCPDCANTPHYLKAGSLHPNGHLCPSGNGRFSGLDPFSILLGS